MPMSYVVLVAFNPKLNKQEQFNKWVTADVKLLFLNFRNDIDRRCSGQRICFAFVSFSLTEEVRIYESGLFDM